MIENEKIRKWVCVYGPLMVFALYTISLMLPGVYINNHCRYFDAPPPGDCMAASADTYPGWSILLLGWIEVENGIIAWLGNPLALISVLFIVAALLSKASLRLGILTIAIFSILAGGWLLNNVSLVDSFISQIEAHGRYFLGFTIAAPTLVIACIAMPSVRNKLRMSLLLLAASTFLSFSAFVIGLQSLSLRPGTHLGQGLFVTLGIGYYIWQFALFLLLCLSIAYLLQDIRNPHAEGLR